MSAVALLLALLAPPATGNAAAAPIPMGHTDEDNQRFGSRALADCIVRTAPAEAKTLILRRNARTEEMAAFRALTPAGASCMRQGVTVSFSKSALRAFIGEALYRLSTAWRAAAREVGNK